MSKARKDWHVDRLTGDLTLEMKVEVNGRILCARSVTSEDYRMVGSGIPFHYVERRLRSQLMAAVEEELLGPRP